MNTTTSSSLDKNQPPSSIVSSSSGENQPLSSSISFIQSQKGKPLLVLDKYIFKLNKTTSTKKYWICTPSPSR